MSEKYSVELMRIMIDEMTEENKRKKKTTEMNETNRRIRTRGENETE